MDYQVPPDDFEEEPYANSHVFKVHRGPTEDWFNGAVAPVDLVKTVDVLQDPDAILSQNLMAKN